MPSKIVICLSCNSKLASIIGIKFIMNAMRSISIVEISTDGSKDIKCHTCHNWNHFTPTGEQSLNHKRKSQDVLNSVKI